MKLKRLLIGFLCILLVLSALVSPGSAYERKKHDKIMTDILFGKYDYARTDNATKDELSAITSACYLTIDQFAFCGAQRQLVRWPTAAERR